MFSDVAMPRRRVNVMGKGRGKARSPPLPIPEGPHSPSQSKSANTTSHTWSESSTLATVLATCCMVTANRKRRRVSSTHRGFLPRVRSELLRQGEFPAALVILEKATAQC